MASSSDSDSDAGHSKKRKRDKKDKKEKKEHKKHKKEKKHKRHDEAAAPPGNADGICYEPISEADYFLKANEFQQWLQESRHTFLDEITSDEARKLFKKFSSKWNAGDLPSKFYAGSVNAAQTAANRTRHTWGFVSKLSDADQLQLDRAADASRKETNLGSGKSGGSGGGSSGSGAATAAAAVRRGPVGPVAGPAPTPGGGRSGTGGGGGGSVAGPGPQRVGGAVPGSRLAELQAKEDERLANFKRSMGL